MKLRNIHKAPVYDSITGVELVTGKSTTDIGFLKDVLDKILQNDYLEPVLTDYERELLTKLVSLDKVAQGRDVTKLEGYDDPYGYKAIENARHEREERIKMLRRQLVSNEREHNKIFKDRNVEDTVQDLVPKKLEGSPMSLQDIKQHNAAVRSENE